MFVAPRQSAHPLIRHSDSVLDVDLSASCLRSAIRTVTFDRFELGRDGQAAINQVWNDMTPCAGYLDRETIVDLDDPGHVSVVSHWTSQGAADRIREEYSHNPNAIKANRLAIEPRRRVVGAALDRSSKAA